MGGKTYVRTAAAAKQFGYSQDYLGQLSREGRIAAKRVGRSWFVDPDSIAAYQEELEAEAALSDAGTDQKQTDSTEGSVPIKTDNRSHPVSVHTEKKAPVQSETGSISPTNEVKKANSTEKKHISVISDNRDESKTKPPVKTQEAVQETAADRPVPQSRINKNTQKNKHISARTTQSPKWHQVAYQTDASALDPFLQKPDETHLPRSQSAADSSNTATTPSRSLRVHSTNDRYSIVPSEMPSVRLQGQIPVAGDEEVKSLSSLTETKHRIATLHHTTASQKTSSVSTDVTTPARTTFQPAASATPATHSAPEKRTATSATLPSGTPPPAVGLRYQRRRWVPLFVLIGSGVVLAGYFVLSLNTIVAVDLATGTTSVGWDFTPRTWSELWAGVRVLW